MNAVKDCTKRWSPVCVSVSCDREIGSKNNVNVSRTRVDSFVDDEEILGPSNDEIPVNEKTV